MKLTRKSYNRRIFTFGTLVFLSAALMSTGFATWIMSKDASQNQTGNVTMGTITGKVSPAKYIGSLTVNLEAKDAVKTNLMKAAGINPETGEVDSSLNQYIVLPECFNTV